MKENNNNIINDNNVENLQNQEPNNQHQLEILACNETLQDFEKYLLGRGFNEMIECVVSKNKNERQNFSYFFKYFSMDTDINSQNRAKSNILFILKLKQILQTLINENKTDKKQQLLAIIAVALQNCKLRESFFPEYGENEKIGDNLLSLLSQAQYFLRLAKKCKVSFSSRNVCDKFLKKDYKEIDVIDSNNFLYCKPHMMPLVSRQEIEDEIKKILIKPLSDKIDQLQRHYNTQLQKLNADGKTASKQGTDIINRQNKLTQDFEKNKQYILSCINNIQNKNIDEATFNTYRNGAISIIVNQNNEFVKQHFKKISTAILEFANTKSQNANTEIIVPTSFHWGKQQNSFIIDQYIANTHNTKNANISLTINTSDTDCLTMAKDNNNIFMTNTINVYNKNNNILFHLKPQNTIVYEQPTTFPDNAIYINSGDHLVFPSNEGHVYCRNKLNANDDTIVNYASTDVAMINTEFFKFLGADGQLTNGIFTFNNNKNAEQNFQSLNMPNIFIFKGKNIDAIKFVSEICRSSISEEKCRDLIQNADKFCKEYMPKQLSQPKALWYDPRTWCSCINGANDSLEQGSENTLNVK